MERRDKSWYDAQVAADFGYSVYVLFCSYININHLQHLQLYSSGFLALMYDCAVLYARGLQSWFAACGRACPSDASERVARRLTAFHGIRVLPLTCKAIQSVLDVLKCVWYRTA